MKLSDWIKENKLSYSQAANKFGIININPATNVQRYAKGERIPHPKVMFKMVGFDLLTSSELKCIGILYLAKELEK